MVKITHASIIATDAANEARCPGLTPELLASCGARYSRSNDGLDHILSKVDPSNMDKSVDSIFKMVDYGHQSIADMVPISMFMDNISMWLVYYMWSLCPLAGGQESSTRYIKFDKDSLPDAEYLGIPENRRKDWNLTINLNVQTYEAVLQRWTEMVTKKPSLMKIPKEVLEDTSPKGIKKIERMKRNYAFDRARYYLPFCAFTNVMMIQSARAWANLCRHLCSHQAIEAQLVGKEIAEKLKLSAPRLVKHATEEYSYMSGLKQEFKRMTTINAVSKPNTLRHGNGISVAYDKAHLSVDCGEHVDQHMLASDLEFHSNRYSYIGEYLKATSVRFSWDAVSIAEIRDLNRHRTGTKTCPLEPVGFYSAMEQCPLANVSDLKYLKEMNGIGQLATSKAYDRLSEHDPSYMYWLPLGAQFEFEHLTTADKFIYEAELRTGTGAHFRYAKHLRDVLQLWYEKFPTTKGLISEGQAEPE